MSTKLDNQENKERGQTTNTLPCSETEHGKV